MSDEQQYGAHEDTVLASWSSVLDELEQAVGSAEQQLCTLRPVELEAWSPPVMPGPLPRELAERARALATRQQAVIAQLPQARARIARQRAITERISQATGRPRVASVYIDASA